VSQHQKRDYLTPFQGHFPGEPALACFIEAKDDGGCGDNWSYKMCKAPVKSSSPTNITNIQLFYRPDVLPVTNSVKELQGKHQK